MRDPYFKWKIEMELWASTTDYKDVQRGPVIALNLEGDARDAALTVPVEELKSADGMKKILANIDTLYKKMRRN